MLKRHCYRSNHGDVSFAKKNCVSVLFAVELQKNFQKFTLDQQYSSS